MGRESAPRFLIRAVGPASLPIFRFCNERMPLHICPGRSPGQSGDMASKRELLEELLAPVVESLGCELWGIDYQTHGRNALLRIYIDSERGIAVEDCEKVSRQVSAVMDVEDPINSRYTLEVSSPGMDRPLYKLEQYQRFIGAQIELRLRMPLDGQRKWRGLLAGVEGDEIVLRIDSENEYLLPIDSIERANIVPQFEGGQK